jgi:hypothetical protein
MSVVARELERAIKYRQRELEGFKTKMALMEEQIEQYKNDLIPKFEQELEELQLALERERLEDEEVPF